MDAATEGEPARQPDDPDDPDNLDGVEARIQHAFSNRALLAEALTHRSARSEGRTANERLEFLGDAVCGLVVGRDLFLKHPDWDEGQLTKVRSLLVSGAPMARAADRLAVTPAVVVGRGLERAGRLPVKVLANVYEAIVGAVYLDGGLEAATRFVLRTLADELAAVHRREVARNWKSTLQELAQRDLGEAPGYRIVREEGPDHRKQFEAGALLAGHEIGRGHGQTKRQAEQKAAEEGLARLLGARMAELRAGEMPTLPRPVPPADPADEPNGASPEPEAGLSAEGVEP